MSRTTDELNSDQVGFRILIAHLADFEPRCGFSLASDLPALTDADVSLICRVREYEVDEYLKEHVGFLKAVQATGATGLPVMPSADALRAACQHVIFSDVQDECARRAEPEDGPLDSEVVARECFPAELLS